MDREDTVLKQYADRLREQRNDMDAATQSKLNQARQRALDEMGSKSRFASGFWLPAAATAVLVLMVAGLSPMLMTSDGLQQGQSAQMAARSSSVVKDDAVKVPDLDMVLAGESLDMIEEVDFYLWLQEEQSSSSTRKQRYGQSDIFG